MRSGAWFMATALAGMAVIATPASAGEEAPKRGGNLTFMIPADAPPSFDGHREGTFAMLHATAPFYSTLIRINPENPSSTTDFVCDLCTEMPQPGNEGRTYTFKLRDGAKFHDGSPLTAADVKASWEHIVFPPEGIISPRQSWYMMVDKIEAPDPKTVVFRLKFATSAFLPALADPFTFIYQRANLDKDPHWYEKNILGSGPFKSPRYETGQSMSGVLDPDYYHKGLPYLDGFTGIFADKQSVRVEAIRGDRAGIEFRGLPPWTRDELKGALGDNLTVQEREWNCGSLVTPNARQKPFDDVRVRRALSLAVDRWNGVPSLGKIANVRTVAGIVFPTSPLAATKEELQQLAGFWPDIEKSRAEARRLLKEAGAEGLSLELLNRNVDQPYKFVGIFLVDEWSKIGVKASQKVLPTGPWFAAMRGSDFDVVVEANCNSIVNPVLDTQKYLPHDVFVENYGYYKDPIEAAIYDKMLREVDPVKQRVLMRQYEKQIVDVEAHEFPMLWWERIVPYQSYVKGWKIGPSHYINQDLADIWLDR